MKTSYTIGSQSPIAHVDMYGCDLMIVVLPRYLNVRTRVLWTRASVVAAVGRLSCKSLFTIAGAGYRSPRGRHHSIYNPLFGVQRKLHADQSTAKCGRSYRGRRYNHMLVAIRISIMNCTILV